MVQGCIGYIGGVEGVGVLTPERNGFTQNIANAVAAACVYKPWSLPKFRMQSVLDFQRHKTDPC